LTGYRVEKILSGLIDDPEQAMFLGAGIAKCKTDRRPRPVASSEKRPNFLASPQNTAI
jgi:hypothetical protein